MARDSRSPYLLIYPGPPNVAGDPRFLAGKCNPESRESRGPLKLPTLHSVAGTAMALGNGVRLCRSSGDHPATVALGREQLLDDQVLFRWPFLYVNSTTIPWAPDTTRCLTPETSAVPADFGLAAPGSLEKCGKCTTFGASSEPDTGADTNFPASYDEYPWTLASGSRRSPKEYLVDFWGFSSGRNFAGCLGSMVTTTTTTPLAAPSLESVGARNTQCTPRMSSLAARQARTANLRDAMPIFNAASLTGENESGTHLLLVAEAVSTLLLAARTLAVLVMRQLLRGDTCPDLACSRLGTLAACDCTSFTVAPIAAFQS